MSTFIQWVLHLCHCKRYNGNKGFGVIHRTVINFLNFWDVWKWLPTRRDLILGNMKISQGAKQWVRWAEYHSRILAANNCRCLSAGNKDINIEQICHKFQAIPYNSLAGSKPVSNLQNGTMSVFGNDSAKFLHVFLCVGCGRIIWTLKIFNQCFPTFESRYQLLSTQWHFHGRLFRAFHVFQMVPSNYPLGHHILYLTRTTRHSPAEVHGCKTH